tara:strand:+ start:84 stop:656 length:573 start_codon:yes stop_codon:yes gene_type:complete
MNSPPVFLPLADKLFYQVDSQMPPVVLEEIIKQVKAAPKHQSNVGPPQDGKHIPDVRSSTNSWLPWDHWISGILHNLFISANNDFFHYKLNHFDSQIQVTCYHENDFYDWHTDATATNHPSEKKLSMSFLLTDDYEGGELEFLMTPKTWNYRPKAGSAIIFPSWLPHRVKPVTKGERLSLVAWENGPVFV